MLRFRSGSGSGRALIIFFLCAAFGVATGAGEGKGKRKKQLQAEQKKYEKGEKGLTDIPLPIGHEAKGLVIPDYDLRGHLSNRFDAGLARRIDVEHIQLRDLKMTTYTPGQKPDLQINMSDSVLNLKTRVISSQQRTTVHRADFNITGDTVQFDTVTRQGTMVGNVKMVIVGQTHLLPKENE